MGDSDHLDSQTGDDLGMRITGAAHSMQKTGDALIKIVIFIKEGREVPDTTRRNAATAILISFGDPLAISKSQI